MIAKGLWRAVLGGLVAVALGAGAARGEDFSIHLNELAAIDEGRALPEYKLERVTVPNERRAAEDMPLKTFDVYLRFKKLGEVCLDRGFEEGPSTGKNKGAFFGTGLVTLEDVKAGWIKDATDLMVVGWVSEHGSGNNPTPDHGVAILRIKGGRAEIVARRGYACGIRTLDFESGWPGEGGRFSWDAKGKRLVETISIARVVSGNKKGPLLKPAMLDEAGTKGFSVQVEESVTLMHKVEDGKLVPQSASFVYTVNDKDDLAEIAAFYLLQADAKRAGTPDKSFQDQASAMKALLEVNPELAAKFKDAKAGEAMALAASTEVRIPLSEKGLMKRYGGVATVASTKPAAEIVPEGTNKGAPEVK